MQNKIVASESECPSFENGKLFQNIKQQVKITKNFSSY